MANSIVLWEKNYAKQMWVINFEKHGQLLKNIPQHGIQKKKINKKYTTSDIQMICNSEKLQKKSKK